MGQVRYLGGDPAARLAPVEELSQWELAAIATGRHLIRCDAIERGDPCDDPGEWRRQWEHYRDAIGTGAGPGRRCAAWWEFDAPGPLVNGESEPEYLHRHGLLDSEELAAIRHRALELVKYNRGRSPEKTAAGYYKSGFVEPDDVVSFAARIGLLDDADRATLNLEPKGPFDVTQEPLHPGRGHFGTLGRGRGR
jgi:hypothetical protein